MSFSEGLTYEGVMRFVKKGKLNPRDVGPYKIMKKVVKIAYKLKLPAELAELHTVFHILLLKKYLGNPAL